MFRNGKAVSIALAATFMMVTARQTHAAEGVKLLYGFEKTTGRRGKPIKHHVEKHATEGKQSLRKILGTWDRYGSGYTADNFKRGLMAIPPKGGYHSIIDWYWQRYANIVDDALAHRSQKFDWSAYDRIRVDVYSENAGCAMGMRVLDSNGPLTGKYGYNGLRSGLAVFKIPADKQVTIEFPMAEMAKIAEMDLSIAQGFVLRFNGYEKGAVAHIDNIRLVSRDAAEKDAKFPLIKMEGPVKPFVRKVIYKPTKRFPEKMKRKTGAVEMLGPVNIDLAPYAGGPFGPFGGAGPVYSQSIRRGCVAYDNDRLCLMFNGGVMVGEGKRARRTGGFYAVASFDGGKTWGGLMPGEKEPLRLTGWFERATGSSDETGDVYLVGTENCCSYHEGYDAFFRRLAFTGEGWTVDRYTMIDQNIRKCPGNSRAWRLPNGRIWATWCHKTAGLEHGDKPQYNLAKYSDDDGYTWVPCKDASAAGLPRPFYEPKLEDLKKPPAERKPPENILIWPSTPIPGPILVPYKGRIATIGVKEWQVHDGEKWLPKKKTPGFSKPIATVLGANQIFMAQTNYDWRGKSMGKELTCAYLVNGEWNQETLETEGVTDVVLTACRGTGNAVFCFYVKIVKKDDAEVNEVRYRRWADGKWGESHLVATENFRINHVTAPMVCPADYAAVFWDERKSRSKRAMPSALRFARIPNK